MGQLEPGHATGVAGDAAGADLRDAIAQLTALNLVDRRGNATERHYTIHNLTRSFLEEQVFKWRDATIQHFDPSATQ